MDDEKKTNISNVIVGPWSTKFKNELDRPWEMIENQKRESTQKKIAEKLSIVDSLTESLMVQVIYTMQENNIDITDEDYITDIGLVAETVKSCLFRQIQYPHILQEMTDLVMERGVMENEFGEEVRYSNFNTAILNDVIDTLYHESGIEYDEEEDTAEQEGKDIYSGSWTPEDIDDYDPHKVIAIAISKEDDDEKDD